MKTIHPAAWDLTLSSIVYDQVQTSENRAQSTQTPSPSPRTHENSERYYKPELDALRLFAFLSVFCCHMLQPIRFSKHSGLRDGMKMFAVSAREAGSFGVSLFFLLSAFLITDLLLREWTQTKTVEVRAFYIRRTMRIWPLYFLGLLGGVLLGTIEPQYRLSPLTISAFVFLAGNWAFSAVLLSGTPMGPLWSISVEEQFYLLWPTLAKLGGRRALLRASILICILSVLTTYVLALFSFDRDRVIFPNSMVQFQFFAIGAIIAILLQGRAPRIPLAGRICLVGAGICMWMVAVAGMRIHNIGLPPSAATLATGYGMVAAGCCAILFGFLGLDARFVPKSARYLGKISYGLYVFHFWMILAATSVVRHFAWNVLVVRRPLFVPAAIDGLALLMTICLAALSYRFFESPFLKIKERFAIIRSRAV
ncbi:MAG TPA: acyltransferase [Candidatus Acidoferrales bacterium]|nr:acyltransferase [Candidatus Acidoferrales bacterium]